jgi:integration host factor subunit alpha
MTTTKKDICKKITVNALISNEDSTKIVNKLFDLIKKESLAKKVKLSGFGTFSIIKTLKRVGRNPKTKESYIITPRNKLNLLSSKKIREVLN